MKRPRCRLRPLRLESLKVKVAGSASLAGRKSQACRALDGWREQRGRARAEAFQEAAVRGLFRKGLDKEVPSSREADIEQPARFFVSFSPEINNALVCFEIDVIDFLICARRKRQNYSVCIALHVEQFVIGSEVAILGDRAPPSPRIKGLAELDRLSYILFVRSLGVQVSEPYRPSLPVVERDLQSRGTERFPDFILRRV